VALVDPPNTRGRLDPEVERVYKLIARRQASADKALDPELDLRIDELLSQRIELHYELAVL
jgi:hypothetical protein